MFILISVNVSSASRGSIIRFLDYRDDVKTHSYLFRQFLSFSFDHPPHKSSIIVQKKRFFVYYISLLLYDCRGNCSSSHTQKINTIPCLVLRLQWQACKLSRWLSRSDENFEGEDSTTKKNLEEIFSANLIRKSKQKMIFSSFQGLITNLKYFPIDFELWFCLQSSFFQNSGVGAGGRKISEDNVSQKNTF